VDGDPDRKATGFSVGQLPESSAITPGGYGQRVGIQSQGSRIQRRAVARVIRDYARRKGHLQNSTRIRVTYRDPPARQQDSASGICQSHPWLGQAGRTRTRSATTVAKAHHFKQEEYPNNTLSVPKGHPKDTLGIAQRYPKDTRRTP